MSKFAVPLRRAVVAAGASGALAVGMLAAAGPARADVLACGTTITASVTLTQDMYCSGTAITIGAVGVTVDLNGHEIAGSSDTGISDVGYNHLTVEHGTIIGFYNDVKIEDSTGSVARDLTVKTEYVFGSTEILLTKASDTTVTHNNFIHPWVGGGDEQGTGNTWSDNTIDKLGLDGSYSITGLAVLATTGDLVSGNKLNGYATIGKPNGAEGIYFAQNSGVTITKNEMHDLAGGMSGDQNTGSTVRLNHGFHNETEGLVSTSGTDETFVGNKFESNSFGMKIESPHGAVLTGNTASDNRGGDGILITGQEGTDSATLSLNTADHNGKSGLYSQFPTSGWGNKAKGNEVTDCFNVICQVPAPIAVGHLPVSVAVDQATDTIYVTNSGSGTMSAIDGHTDAVTATIAVGHTPEGVAVDPATDAIYVANAGGTVSAFDGHTHALTATITVGILPVSVAVDPASDTIYVANYISNTVSAIDGHTHAITATIAVGQGPFGVAVDPASDTIYVANYLSDTVSAIDGHSHAVTATIAVGHHPQGVAVDPATDTIYVANNSSDTVSAIDGHSHAVTATIAVGHGPKGVAVDNATDTVYASNSGSDTVSAIDGHSHAVTATIAVGHGPNGLALASVADTLYTLYVANTGSDTVSVIP